MTTDKTSLETRLLHTGMSAFDSDTGAAAVALPAVRTSTVRFKDLDALAMAQRRKNRGERAATYGRVGLDTHEALESVFQQLENGVHAHLAPSGLAAITLALLSLLSAGDHALVADCVYGPVRHLDHEVLRRMNIELTYFGASDDIAQLQRPNTKLIYIESPGSLLFEMLDIPALAAIARKLGLPLLTDNTWGSGYIYKPLDLGASMSIVAGTKYVGGHSDLMLGAVVANDPEIAQRINTTHYALGYSLSADDAWLAIRGVRTIAVRMVQHARHALEVCDFLDGRAEVTQIFHPAWHKDAGHALWKRDCTGSNGMMAVHLKLTQAQARVFVEALTLFGIGFSWGGYESLVQLVDMPALESHAYWGLRGAEGAPQGGSVVRLHIGLESPADLIADLEQALKKAAGAG